MLLPFTLSLIPLHVKKSLLRFGRICLGTSRQRVEKCIQLISSNTRTGTSTRTIKYDFVEVTTHKVPTYKQGGRDLTPAGSSVEIEPLIQEHCFHTALSYILTIIIAPSL